MMFRMFRHGSRPDLAMEMRNFMWDLGMHGLMGHPPAFGRMSPGRNRGKMRRGDFASAWGPAMSPMWSRATTHANRLSAADVRKFLSRWVEENQNLEVTDVVEQEDGSITADIVTKKSGDLVQRFRFDARTGLYEPVQDTA